MSLFKSYQEDAVMVQASALYWTNTTWVKGDKTLLICDPNWLPDEIDAILAAILPLVKTHRIYYLFTHADYDHIIGYGAMPPGQVVTSHDMAHLINRENALDQVRRWDGQHYIQRHYEHRFPVADLTVTNDGQQLQLGEFNVTCFLAAGHTADGAMYFIRETGTLLLGDYLSALEFPFIEDSWYAYVRTLDKVADTVIDLDWTLAIPGHGPCYESYQDLWDRLQADQGYLQRLKVKSQAADWEKIYPFAGFLANEHRRNERKYQAENKT
ncbi:MAG: hypothetical protein R2806_13390 [Saprospiraceae bacterium]